MMAQGRGGCLLFNASKSAFNAGPGFGPYAVAKSALVALMRQYAVDLGPSGIRSNAVNADRIRTRLFAEGVAESRAKARGLSPDEYFRANLLGREVDGDRRGRRFRLPGDRARHDRMRRDGRRRKRGGISALTRYRAGSADI